MTDAEKAPPRVTWLKGGAAAVLTLVGDVIALSSTVPSPPGSRIEGVLESPPATTLRVKIHGSKRQSDGSFRLDGRVIDMTRVLREALIAQIAAATSA